MIEFVTGVELAFSHPKNYSWYLDGELLFMVPIPKAMQFMAPTQQAFIEGSPLENRISLNDLNNPNSIAKLIDSVFTRLLGTPHSLQDLLYLNSATKAYDLLLTFQNKYGIDYVTSKGRHLTNFVTKIGTEIEKKYAENRHPIEIKLEEVLRRIQTLPQKKQWEEYQTLLSLLNYQHEVCEALEAYTRIFFLVHILKQDESYITSTEQNYRVSKLALDDGQSATEYFTESIKQLTEFDPGLAIIFVSTFSEATKSKLQFDPTLISSQDFFADVDHIRMTRLLEIMELLRTALENNLIPIKLQLLLENLLKSIEGRLIEEERKKIDSKMIPLFKGFTDFRNTYEFSLPDYYELLPLKSIVDSHAISISKTMEIIQRTGSINPHDLNMMNFLYFNRFREEYEFTKKIAEKAYRIGYDILFAQPAQNTKKKDKYELFSRRNSFLEMKHLTDPDQLFGKREEKNEILPSEATSSNQQNTIKKEGKPSISKIDHPHKKKKEKLPEQPKSSSRTKTPPPLLVSQKMNFEQDTITYSDYVDSWFTDPTKALESPRFKDLPYSVQNKIRIFHTFSKEIDKYVFTEGLADKIRQTKTKNGETHYFLPGRITIDKLVYTGVYGYAFNKEQICYHRCFTETNADTLVRGYLAEGFQDIEFPSLTVEMQRSKNKSLHSRDLSETITKVNSYTMEIANHESQTKATVYLIKNLTQDVN